MVWVPVPHMGPHCRPNPHHLLPAGAISSPASHITNITSSLSFPSLSALQQMELPIVDEHYVDSDLWGYHADS